MVRPLSLGSSRDRRNAGRAHINILGVNDAMVWATGLRKRYVMCARCSVRRDHWRACVAHSVPGARAPVFCSGFARPPTIMLISLVLFFASAVAIYLACEFFVNGVEWVGCRLQLGATAVGTLLAAFGTALPESAVTFVAVMFGETAEQREIGVGAAIGGPLVLATLAYAVVGISLLRRNRMAAGSVDANSLVLADQQRIARDQAWFMVIFIVKIALGVLVFSWKPWLAIAFLAAYGLYVMRELNSDEGSSIMEELEPLRIRPSDPSMFWALVQTALALVVIAFASHVFVEQIEFLGAAAGLAPSLAAMLLAPIATELPEVLNSIIWTRKGKERLALANISGAMMIQSTIPTAMALSMTPWQLSTPLLVAAACTFTSIGVLWLSLRRKTLTAVRLVVAAGFYAAFAAYAMAAMRL